MKKMILSSNHPVFTLLSLCSLVASVSVASPKLHCAEPKYDFGTVVGGGAITNRFVLENTGDEPVVVSKIKDCCGVASKLVPMTILPGSNAVCTSVFTTKNRYGKQDKQILLATNVRRKPYFELKMAGTLQRAIEVEPRYLRLGELQSGNAIDQTITATNLLAQPVVLESVNSTVPGIGVEIETTEYTEEGLTAKERTERKENRPVHNHSVKNTSVAVDAGRRRNWTIRLSAPDVLKPGKLGGRIQLNFSTGTVSVPVMGTVKPAIQVVPASIRLSGKTNKPAERLVMLRSEKPFEVTSASLENAEGSVEPKRLADGKWVLRTVLDASSVQAGARLVAGTTCGQQPQVLVPLLLSKP